MKKVFLLILSLIVMSTGSFAQGKKKATKGAETKQTQIAPANGQKLKKDGTPDKRYKDNKKAEAAPAGPTKKDGTPDKRYKSNKAATQKK